MARKRYFRAELQWVFGVCAECKDTKSLVTRLPHAKVRSCAKCLARHRRLLAERVA